MFSRKYAEMINYEIYNNFHKHCPKCDGTNITRTLTVSCILINQYDGESGDANLAQCINCGWKGIASDLLPKDKDLGPLKEGHVCKHHIRWPHECLLCEDYIYKVRTGDIPLL